MPNALTVTAYKDNPDGTTTNTLSDGSTDTVRNTPNPDGSLTSTPISAASLTPSKPFNLTAPNPATQTDGALGYIGTQNDTFTQNLLANQQARAQASGNSLNDYLTAAVATPGSAQLTANAYADTVDPAQAKLRDINSQILAEQNALNHRLNAFKQTNTQGLFGTGMDQEVQRIKDESLARQADLSVIQAATQGQYDSAKQIADRAVAAKVEQNKNLLDALKLNFETNRDLFSKAEERSFLSMLNDRNKALDIQTYAEKAYYDQLIKQHDPKYQEELKQLQYQNGDVPSSTPTYATPGDPVSAASAAIMGNESNGSYSTLSPILPSGSAKGDRSYGKYQVLGSNIPSWTKQYYGQELTPQEFLNNPAAQEAVQKGKIADLWNKYGNIQDVASVYFSGVPYEQAVKEGRRDQATGMTVQDYVAKAAQRFGGAAPAGTPQTPSYSPQVLSYANGVRSGTIKMDDVPKGFQPQVLAAVNDQSLVTPQQKQESLTNYQIADNLLNNPNLNGAFGLNNLNPLNYIPGSPVQLAKNQVAQLQSMLSLDNRSKLKGSGAISDFESRTLANAASTLGPNISAEDARKVIVQIRGAFANAAGLPAPVKITDSSGKSQVVNATRQQIQSAIEDGHKVEYYDPTQDITRDQALKGLSGH